MSDLLKARLERNYVRLHQLYVTSTILHRPQELQYILASSIEDLHQLYPDHIPDGQHYHTLQHLAHLDLLQQDIVTGVISLKETIGWNMVSRALIAALELVITSDLLTDR